MSEARSEPTASRPRRESYSAREVAHDLNNLLAVIQGRAEMILADERLTEQGLECVDQIMKAADRAGTLVRRLGAGPSRKTSQPEETPDPTPRHTPALGRGSEKLLVALADQGVRRFAALLLEDLGYSVTQGPSPSDAARIWREKQGDFDLLLSDFFDGAPGQAPLLESFRQDKPQLKAVLVSAGEVPSTVLGPDSLANVRLLARPFAPDQLALAIRQCLDA